MGQLVNCKSCGKGIAKSAKACPGCGAPRNSISWIKVIGGGFLGIFLFLTCVGIAGNKRPERSADGPPATMVRDTKGRMVEAPVIANHVTARYLDSAYSTNEVAADAAYKGQLLSVTGTVGTIGKDILGDPFVQFESRELLGGVMCMFSEKDNAALAQLVPGQRITAHGRGAGYSIGHPMIERCTIE